MQQFIRWVIVGVSTCTICFCGLSFGVFHSPDVAIAAGYPKAWMNVLRCAQAAKRNVIADTLYVGDSVAGQVMPFNGSNVLTSNGSVYAAGNYLIVQDALRNNPEITTVVYMSVPQVIGHKFERQRTWNNFVKPLWLSRNLGRLDSTVLSKVKHHQAWRTQLFIPVKFLPISEVDMEDGAIKPNDILSDFALHWLERMRRLCAQRAVTFRLISPPVSSGAAAESEDWGLMRAQVEGTELEGLFRDYFASIVQYPDSALQDKIHWKSEFVEQHRSEMLDGMLSSIGHH